MVGCGFQAAKTHGFTEGLAYSLLLCEAACPPGATGREPVDRGSSPGSFTSDWVLDSISRNLRTFCPPQMNCLVPRSLCAIVSGNGFTALYSTVLSRLWKVPHALWLLECGIYCNRYHLAYRYRVDRDLSWTLLASSLGPLVLRCSL